MTATLTATTGDDPNTIGTQHGYYKFPTVLAGSYWLSIDPTNYNAGNPLAGKVATTGNSVTALTLTEGQANLTQDIGFTAAGTSYPLTSAGNFTVGGGLTLSSGRVAPTPASTGASPAWWNTNWHYRLPLTVTANAQTLDTTKTIVLSTNLATLVSGGKAQADFDDVRLEYWNGSSNVDVPLEIIDASTQRFKVQATITAGNSNSNYYLYYGNSAATKAPVELNRVYDYYTSFNAPDSTTYGSWQESSGADWQIQGNKWRQLTTVTGNRFSRDTSKIIDLGQNWAEEATIDISNTGERESRRFDLELTPGLW